MLDRSLPAEQYYQDEIYETERRSIFTNNWVLVAHCQEIPEIGDQIARTVANFPLLIAKTPNGITGYINVCLHRAGPLVWDGTKSNGQVLRCRYHGWTYNWAGELTYAPDFGSACPTGKLKKIHIAIKLDLIFVCIETPKHSIEDTFPFLWEGLLPFSLEAYKLKGEEKHNLDCNWKTYVENYLEGYHVPYVHPSLQKEIKMRSYRIKVHNRSITHHVSTKENAMYNGYWGYAWPNLAVNIYDGGFSLERIVPVETKKTRIEYLYFFHPDISDDDIKDRLAMSRQVTLEDIKICNAIQHNLSSGCYSAGELSPKHENGVNAFHNWVRGS
jgi:choline monooxygenase